MTRELEERLEKIPVINWMVRFLKKIKIPGFQGLSLYYLLESSLKFNYGKYSSGELGIEDSSNKKRVLSCANFARWQFE